MKYIFYADNQPIAIADDRSTIEFLFLRYPNGNIVEVNYNGEQPVVTGAQTL